MSVGEAWAAEQATLRPLPTEPFDARVHVSGRLDQKRRLTVLRTRYSAPAGLAGLIVAAAVSSTEVVIVDGGREVARHERVYGIGTAAGSSTTTWRCCASSPGPWPARCRCARRSQRAASPAYVELFRRLRERHGESEGAGQMVDAVFLHRDHWVTTALMAVEEP